MALRKFVYIDQTEGFATEQASNDELSIGKLALVGVSGVALDGGATRATNFADPTAAQDLATKAYVDATASGLDVKKSVRAATTGSNITLAGGAPNTLDGVTLAANDRILVKDQTAGAENGIYYVSTLGTGADGTWTRADDADTSTEVTAGMFTFVTEGTTWADTGWVLSTNDPITLGTTALTFTQFSSAGVIQAGAGLTKSGNTLDVGAGNGITVNADDVAVNLSATPGLEFSGGALQVKANTAAGIEITASGVGVDLAATSPGLEFDGSGDLQVQVVSTGGIERTASGIQVKIDDTPDTLDSDVDGLKVVGLPSLFKINGTAVGATVTAPNLDTLTNGSNADSLHTHAAQAATEAPKVENTYAVDEAVAAGDPLYITATGSRVGKALANTDSKAKVVGVARTAQATPGSNTEMVTAGPCAGVLSGATPGTAYYLAAAGGLTTSLPASGNRLIQVGIAISATDLFVRIVDYGKKA